MQETVVATNQSFSSSRWVRLTWLGWLLGFVFILALSILFDGIGLDGFQFSIGLGMGGGVALLQWLMLRKLGVSAAWIWVTTLLMAIPFITYDLIFHNSADRFGSAYLPVCVGVGALLVSAGQFMILKNVSTRAIHWIWGSFLAWLLACATVVSIDFLKAIPMSNLLGFVVNLALILGGGVVLGLVSGGVLKRILG